MDNAELFHRWANRVRDKGTSGNVFYEGPILYSYGHHFPLAVLTGKGKPEIVLVNSRRYSTTTSGHRGQAVCASSHLVHIYVPRPDRDTSGDNLEHLNKETQAAYEAIKTARSRIDSHESTARDCETTAKLYRKTFHKGKGKLYTLPKDFDAALTAAREREKKHDAWRATKQERYRTAYELRKKLDAIADAEKAAAWRTGGPGSLFWGVPCMLRLKGDDTCETSLGAEIPLSHAERVYRLILGIMAKGKDWETNGHTIPVGVYKIDKITADGTLTAGCHTITFEEIARFAGERGWK